MEEQERRKKTLLILVVVAMLLFVVGLILLARKDVEPETEGSTGIVQLDDRGKLQEMLFDVQYYAVQAGLSDYISSRISPDITSAEIVGAPTVPADGTISFKVRVTDPDKTFTVLLDRQTHFDKIILSVEGTSYKKTLPVYEDTAPSDAEVNEIQ